MRITNIIFDFDGTIVDSAPAILDCLGKSLNECGYVPKVTLDNSLIGPPLIEVMKLLSGVVDETELNKLIGIFKSYYDSWGVRVTKLYPDVREELIRLLTKGYQLYIATNKRDRPTRIILEQLELISFFKKIYAIDTVLPQFNSKKDMIEKLLFDLDLSVSNSCYVGDRVDDAIAARSSNLQFLHAAWGYVDGDLTQSGWVKIEEPKLIFETIESMNNVMSS